MIVDGEWEIKLVCSIINEYFYGYFVVMNERQELKLYHLIN